MHDMTSLLCPILPLRIQYHALAENEINRKNPVTLQNTRSSTPIDIHIQMQIPE
jgi:hypothetical protein